ncbi:MAG: hypothetical protein ACYDBH_00325 [Acidobacteriaceae bacterium]
MLEGEVLEAAARKLCELRGIDPDARVGHGAGPDARGFIPAVMVWSSAWQLVAQEISAWEQLAEVVGWAHRNRAELIKRKYPKPNTRWRQP